MISPQKPKERQQRQRQRQQSSLISPCLEHLHYFFFQPNWIYSVSSKDNPLRAVCNPAQKARTDLNNEFCTEPVCMPRCLQLKHDFRAAKTFEGFSFSSRKKKQPRSTEGSDVMARSSICNGGPGQPRVFPSVFISGPSNASLSSSHRAVFLTVRIRRTHEYGAEHGNAGTFQLVSYHISFTGMILLCFLSQAAPHLQRTSLVIHTEQSDKETVF